METNGDKNQAKKAALLAAIALMESGFAGMSKDGGIVDRRKVRDASPIMENSMLRIGKPQKLPPLAICQGCLDEIPYGEEKAFGNFTTVCQQCINQLDHTAK